MITGIYKIENTVNNKVYIGQSKDILSRFSNHKYELNKNKHPNSHLQRAWNKYGKNNFSFEILCKCNIEELNEKEIYFIEIYCSFENGYNRTGGGTDSEAASEYGRRMAEITHAMLKSRKNECLECGQDTRDGYNKYCDNHRLKCLKCGKRYGDLNHPVSCETCRITYGKENSANPITVPCFNCGKEINKTSNKQKYCKECAKIIHREKHKLIMRKIRSVRK